MCVSKMRPSDAGNLLDVDPLVQLLTRLRLHQPFAPSVDGLNLICATKGLKSKQRIADVQQVILKLLHDLSVRVVYQKDLLLQRHRASVHG